MTDGEDDARYPHDPYADDDDDDDDDDDEGVGNIEVEDDDDDDDDEDDDDGGTGVQRIGKDDYESLHDDDDDGDLKHPKKRKLKTLLASYEFAPRAPPPPSASASASAPKPSHGGRNPLTDWTEHETLVLLDAWGDRFLKQGRKSLRSEEWQEVAEKVSHGSKIERTDTQCRNRLDTLKKKYKKEKAKPGVPANNWTYFKKMDSLLGLSCGAHSGEYVFTSRSSGLDEMRGSPGNSEPESVLPKRGRRNGRGSPDGGSFKLLADSIRKFSDVYKRIESCKREQMVELERMRMDFHRDLEMQKREILERARVQIEKIRHGDDEDND